MFEIIIVIVNAVFLFIGITSLLKMNSKTRKELISLRGSIEAECLLLHNKISKATNSSTEMIADLYKFLKEWKELTMPPNDRFVELGDARPAGVDGGYEATTDAVPASPTTGEGNTPEKTDNDDDEEPVSPAVIMENELKQVMKRKRAPAKKKMTKPQEKKEATQAPSAKRAKPKKSAAKAKTKVVAKKASGKK